MVSNTYATITLENGFTRCRIDTPALVNSGCAFLTIPEAMAKGLGFDVTEVATRNVRLADGTPRTVPIVGPIRVYFAGRFCDVSALVFGDEPLVGVVPMEMMDLVLHPLTQTLAVNPASPDAPQALAKGYREVTA